MTQTYSLRDSGLVENEVEPVEVGLVRVGGSVVIRVEGGRPARAVVDVGSGERHPLSVLDVEVGLQNQDAC